ncbi:MAG: histidine kinase [Bacteroidota bacterium]
MHVFKISIIFPFHMAFNSKASPGIFNKKDIVIRHILIALLALFFGTVGKGAESHEDIWRGIASSFVMIAIIWNGNILLIDLIDRDLNWDKQLHLKLILSGSIALVWPVFVNYFFNLTLFPLFHGHPCNLQSKESITYLIISVAITLFVNSVFVAIAFFRFWKSTIKEKEELKRESLSAEFETLKNQINPHFLFNSLNTLTSLIEENPKTATDFVQKLSSVYRYLLTQKDKETVTLREEVNFVRSYIYLNQIRFGANLQFHIHIDQAFLERKIVTLSLQMLIENAIKHNVISQQHPLAISIGIHRGKVFVKNNLQRKTVMNESHGIGLNNIIHRYSFLTKEEVEIVDDGIVFYVSLPLLHNTN